MSTDLPASAPAPRDSTGRFRSIRFVTYGILVGLIAGVPLGVLLSTQDWLVGDYMPTNVSAASGQSSAMRPGDPREAFNLDDLAEPLELILHGGPEKDGIPALTDPKVVALSEADHLKHDDRVIGVTVGGETRGYPIAILNYHEIVNDELGGVPIAIVYCPLCDSVSVIERTVDGDVLTFGVSGLLLYSNVLMYDRKHEALWTQVGGRAISGPHVGQDLAHLHDWEISPYAAWAEQHPDATVLSFETGHRRDYRRSPYEGYRGHDELYFPVERDERLPRRKVPVVGICVGDDCCAIPVEAIVAAQRGQVELEVGGKRVTLAAQAGAQEVAVLESPAGAQIVHTLWFAWAAFHPETRVISAAAALPRDDSDR